MRIKLGVESGFVIFVMGILVMLGMLMMGQTYAVWTNVHSWLGVISLVIATPVLMLFSLATGEAWFEDYSEKEKRKYVIVMLQMAALLLAPIIFNWASGLVFREGYEYLAGVLFRGRFWIPWGGILAIILVEVALTELKKPIHERLFSEPTK